MPNVLSPRDLVFRPDNMDETVSHTKLITVIWLITKYADCREFKKGKTDIPANHLYTYPSRRFCRWAEALQQPLCSLSPTNAKLLLIVYIQMYACHRFKGTPLQ